MSYPPSPQNPNTHLTVKERKYPSFAARYLHQNNLLQGRILDFGCGLGKDVSFLQEQGFEVVGYDNYYYPDYPTGKFDTIMCHYVLNVLLPEEQTLVLMQIAELLQPTGKAFFTVRRDVKKNGYVYNPKRNATVYQCNVVLNYKSLLTAEHCEIYEYQHYNRLDKTSDCVFCAIATDRELITETATVFAIYAQPALSKGHALIVAKRHISNYFDLSLKEQQACWFVANRVQQILQQRFNPDGFNISVSTTQAKGQTTEHTHIHLIPHYIDDKPQSV
jgi:ATP adenylyltransferase